MEHRLVFCRCRCGGEEFQVRLDRDEQVGLLTCRAGHHSLLLDSRDHWAEAIQDERPRFVRCKCAARHFRVGLDYKFREDGDIQTVDILLACSTCPRQQRELSFEIDYGPTIELLERPIDPIDKPWVKPRQTQITAYWRPCDAERFALHLSHALAAKVYRRDPEWRECDIGSIRFTKESTGDLYFSHTAQISLPNAQDPQKVAPLLRLSAPFRIAVSSGIALLYYIEYSKEIPVGPAFLKQAQEFLSFASEAELWLRKHYPSTRGKNTADHPEEFARIVELLPDKS